MNEVINNEYNWCVYVHINKINNKMYVGQTIHGDNPNLRWRNGKAYRKQPYFGRAIEKYGWDGFEHEVIASNMTKEEAYNFETLLIKKLDTTNPHKGYNNTDGGKGTIGHHHTKEAKNKISEANKGRFGGKNSPMYGKHLSEETKQKISNSLKGKQVGANHPMYGKHHSEKTKQHWSEIRKGKQTGEDNPMYGKHLSDKTKQKLRDANKGKHLSYETRKKMSESRKKPIVQIDKNTNKIIKQWDSAKSVEKELNLSSPRISECCKGKRKSAGGFLWKYAEECEYGKDNF